jgi:transposase
MLRHRDRLAACTRGLWSRPHAGNYRLGKRFCQPTGTDADATESQELEDWIGSHIRAFELFQGVPKLVISANARHGPEPACLYEPDLNRTYHELAMHYGVGVLPARPYKPRNLRVEVDPGTDAENVLPIT